MDFTFGFEDIPLDEPTYNNKEDNKEPLLYEHKENEVIETKEGLKEKTYPNEFCFPVTIKLLLNNMINNELKIHNFHISGIILCGKICDIKKLASTTIYKICDYTGSIEVVYNKDSKNEKVLNHTETININDHIKVIGGVYYPSDSDLLQVSIKYFNKIDDWLSYSLYFTIDIISSYLRLFKLKELNQNDQKKLNISKPWDYINLKDDLNNLDNTQKDIMKFLLMQDNKETVESSLTSALLPYYTEIEIKLALTKLIEIGELCQSDNLIAVTGDLSDDE